MVGYDKKETDYTRGLSYFWSDASKAEAYTYDSCSQDHLDWTDDIKDTHKIYIPTYPSLVSFDCHRGRTKEGVMAHLRFYKNLRFPWF